MDVVMFRLNSYRYLPFLVFAALGTVFFLRFMLKLGLGQLFFTGSGPLSGTLLTPLCAHFFRVGFLIGFPPRFIFGRFFFRSLFWPLTPWNKGVLPIQNGFRFNTEMVESYTAC